MYRISRSTKSIVLALAFGVTACDGPKQGDNPLTECDEIKLADIHPVIEAGHETREFPLAITGGTPPYSVELVSGTLPEGLELDSSGVLVGAPGDIRAEEIVVAVQDSVGATAELQLVVDVVAPAWDETRIVAERPLADDERERLPDDPNWGELTEGLAGHDLYPAPQMATRVTYLQGEATIEVTLVPAVTSEGTMGGGSIILQEPGNPEAFAFALALVRDEAGQMAALRWYGGGGVLEVGLSRTLFLISVSVIRPGIAHTFDNIEDWYNKAVEALPWYVKAACAIICAVGAVPACLACLGGPAVACLIVPPTAP